jgi:hypothetical protein
MKPVSFLFTVAALAAFVTAPVFAADEQPAAAAATPTNMARGFSGAGAYLWDDRARAFVALPALASVIDDDVTSGWTPAKGKTKLLIQLQQDADVSAFTLFAPGAEGSYSIEIAEDQNALASGETKKLASGVDLGTANRVAMPATNAKFLIIEMDVVTPAPVRGVQVLGLPLAGSKATIAVVAPKSDDDKGNKDKGEVVEVNFALTAVGGATTVQTEESNKLIDGDTATASKLPAGSKDAVIRLASSVAIDRIALAVGRAEGSVTVFVNDGKGNDLREIGVVKMDGKSDTLSIETPGIRAEFVRLEWQPSSGSSDLVIKEVGVFAQARVTRSEPPPNASVATLPVFVMPPAAPPPVALPPPEPVAVVRATSG